MPRRALGVCLPALLHCSVLYGDPEIVQCTSDAECAEELGSAPGHCDVELQICVRAVQSLAPASGDVPACLAAGEPGPRCTSERAGDPACPLASPECPCVEGAFDDPTALVIGTLAPHTLSVVSGQELQIPYVPRWLRSVELGLEEWRATTTGGRLPRTQRPLALVHCNSRDDLPRARKAMAHLIEVAHAPVVVTLTDNDTNAVRYQALRQATTLICATCFSTPPAAPEEMRLIWPIAPPLVTQAPLIAWRVSELEAALRAEQALPAEVPLDVVILSQDYPGIDELASELVALLGARAGVRLTSIRSSDPRVELPVQLELSRSVVAARPRVVVALVDADFTTYYLPMIEEEWPEGEPRPTYVLTHMNQELGLFADIVRDDDLRRRIGGTGFGLSAGARENLDGLERRFQERHGQPLDNTQYGYDAFYAALYGLLKTEAGHSLEGNLVSASLGQLVSGPLAHVGPQGLESSIVYMRRGQSVDLVGASGDLDWQPETHRIESDVVLWCLSRDAAGGLTLLDDAGPRLHHDTGEISGQYVCP